MSTSDRRLIVAELGRPHGVRGEIMARLSGIHVDEFVAIGRFTLRRRDGSEGPIDVESARPKKDGWILSLGAVRDRDDADGLRGAVLLADRSELPEPDENEWFVADLVGMTVTTDDGETLGEIADVLVLPANDVLVVRGPRGEILLPVTDEVVKEVDVAAARMRVHVLPGLLDEEPTTREEAGSGRDE